jgi:hypothetical protein
VDVGERIHPALEVSGASDHGDRRLLEHDLGDEHAVRIGIVAPRERAAVPRVPIEERALQRPDRARLRRRPARRFHFALMRSKISSCSGNRPVFFFEKTSFPSTTTSKTPPDPSISSAVSLVFFSIAAARPVALGR